MKALQTNAVDRYGMAEAMVEAGLDVTFGDFMFALGMPIAIKTLAGVRVVAALLLPVVTQFPIPWLYALGSEQDKPPEPKWQKYYREADVLAGDFIQVRQYMPEKDHCHEHDDRQERRRVERAQSAYPRHCDAQARGPQFWHERDGGHPAGVDGQTSVRCHRLRLP
jgi:hypothetical protein